MIKGLSRSRVTTLVIISVLVVGIVVLAFVFLWPRASPTVNNTGNVTSKTNNQPSAIQQFSGMTDGQEITGDTIITLAGSNTTGVVRSELYVDGQIAATSYAYPFDLNFSVAGYNSGEHSVYIKTYDSHGGVRTSATIKIMIAPVSVTPPSDTSQHGTFPSSRGKKSTPPPATASTAPVIVPAVSLPTTPSSLAVEVVPGSETKLHISWSPSTDASGIASYDLYRDGTLLSSSVSPEAYDRTAVPGHAYSYAVKAIAQNNNTSALSTAVSMQLAPESVWSNTDVPSTTDTDPTPIEVGERFRVHAPGMLVGLRFYKGPGNTGVHTIHLWDENHNQIAVGTAKDETADGWQQAYFDSPVAASPETQYTVSYGLSNGHYSYTSGYFVTAPTNQYITAFANGDGGSNGVFGSTLGAFPSTSFNGNNYWVDPLFIPDASVGANFAVTKVDTSHTYTNFPGSNNTGVPAGRELDLYTGKIVFSNENATIDNKVIYGGLRLSGTSQVTVTNSIIYGRIDNDTGASLTLRDTTVDAGEWQNSAIGFSNMTIERVNVKGGTTGVNCANDCVISDSWLHGQYLGPISSVHLGGFLSNGGSNIELDGNTISCDVPNNSSGGGCSGAAQLYGDFDVNQNVTFDGNLFTSTTGAYCTSFGYNPGKPYGSNPTNIIIKNNIWQRGSSGVCGAIAVTTSFLNANGNQWTNNLYDDGVVINP